MTTEVQSGATRAAVDGYFERLRGGGDWPASFSDDVRFTSFTSPLRTIAGRDAFVAATGRFYGMIRSFELKELIVDGHRACALTQYVLAPDGLAAFESDVAEIFEVRDGAIASFGIYFDSAPYPKR